MKLGSDNKKRTTYSSSSKRSADGNIFVDGILEPSVGLTVNNRGGSLFVFVATLSVERDACCKLWSEAGLPLFELLAVYGVQIIRVISPHVTSSIHSWSKYCRRGWLCIFCGNYCSVTRSVQYQSCKCRLWRLWKLRVCCRDNGPFLVPVDFHHNQFACRSLEPAHEYMFDEQGEVPVVCSQHCATEILLLLLYSTLFRI